MALKVPFGIDSTKFKSGLDDMRNKTKDFGKKVDKDLDKGTKGFMSMSTSIGLVTAGLTALGAIAVASIARVSQKIKMLNNQSGEAAVKVEELQVILQAAFKTGAGSEQTVAALKNVNTRAVDAANGAKQYQDALARLNIDFQKFVNLPGERKLEQVAKGFVGAEDEAQAYRDILTLLGEDAGPKLIKFLEQLGTQGFDKINAKMRESGQIIEKDIVDNLKDAQEAWDDLQNKIGVKTTQVAGGVANLVGAGKEDDVNITRAALQDQIASVMTLGLTNFFGAGSTFTDAAVNTAAERQASEATGAKSEAKTKDLIGQRNKARGVTQPKAERSIADEFKRNKNIDKLFGEFIAPEKKAKDKRFQGVPVSSLQAIGGGGGVGSVNNMKLNQDRNKLLEDIKNNTAGSTDGSGNFVGPPLG